MALGKQYVPRLGTAHSARLDSIVWVFLPGLAVLVAGSFLLVLPPRIREQHQLGLLIALAVFSLPLLWAYVLARRARVRYRSEWDILNRTRKTTLDDRVRIENGRFVDSADMLKAGRYLKRDAATSSQEECIAERMLHQALTNAKELRRDSDLATQIYIRDLSPMRVALRVPQTVALRLGILLSFVGLLQGLEPVATLYRAGVGSDSVIAQMVSGLTSAFSCSVAGIGAAILIQLMIVIVDRDYLIVARLLETTWMDLGYTLAKLRIQNDLPGTINQLLTEVAEARRQIHEDVKTHGAEVQSASVAIRAQLHEAADAIKANDARFAEHVRANERTKESLADLAAAHAARVGELADVMEQVAQYEARWEKLLQQRLDQTIETEKIQHEAYRRELDLKLIQLQERVSTEIAGLARQEGDLLSQSVSKLERALGEHAAALSSSAASALSSAQQVARDLAAATAKSHRTEESSATPSTTAPASSQSLVLPVGAAILLTLVIVYSTLYVLSR